MGEVLSSRRARTSDRAQASARLLSSSKGSVTAEFAIILPTIVMVLGMCVAAVSLIASHVRLSDTAADVARLLARNDDPSLVHQRMDAFGSGLTLLRSDSDGVVCVELSTTSSSVHLLGIFPISARGCALAWSTEVTGD